MYKYFAKPLFLAKSVEFLPQCHSTNEEMLHRAKFGKIQEGHIIYTDHQLDGRGQRGNSWKSEPGKNLLFSLYLKPVKLSVQEIYLVNVIAGLAAAHVLQKEHDLEIKLKWPNDLYVNNRKLGGILVESSLSSGRIEGMTLGMGINVNQRDFDIPTATSVSSQSDQVIERLPLLEDIISSFETYYLKLRNGKTRDILSQYYQIMMWRGEIHQYQSVKEFFDGEIIGIDNTGRLIIKTNGIARRFAMKEITFIK